ncbi:MAG: hypothetical protein IT383_24920 [Deltaproteobacteria bacterium]|nr:hypothetical protein [Deltaproteobacteria bacterium]
MPTATPLEIAGVSAQVDPLAPWIGARNASERALAATFLVSIGGISGVLHACAVGFALVLTLLPLPFLPLACGQVKHVSFRPPERVEMAIVEVEPPPVIEEIPPPVEAPASNASKAKKAKAVDSALLSKEVGLLAILGSAPSSDVFGTLSSNDDSAVLGALIGDQIGDSFGYGGLGLSGVGVAGGVEGGGGGASIGLGGLGTIGHGGGGGAGSGYGSGFGSGALTAKERRDLRVDVVETDLDRAAARRALLRATPALLACDGDFPVDLTVRVTDGSVRAVEGASVCVRSALMGRAVPGTGYVAAHLALR